MKSQRGEKEKDPFVPDQSEDQASDADADTSLMDRTKKQVRAARDHHKKKSKSLHSTEDELLDLEQLLAETKEKAEATKAVKARSAAIRRQLDDLRQAEPEDPQGVESDSDPEDQPVTKSQIADLFSSSLHSSVSFFLTPIPLRKRTISCLDSHRSFSSKQASGTGSLHI